MKKTKKWIANFLLLLSGTLVGLLIAEIATRFLHPISPGAQKITLEGQPIQDWLQPGTVYRQVSSEYDANTTITEKGHRAPKVQGNPDVVFLGDSFTFGQGLTDQETFAYIYCSSLNVSCANLGTPGAGTVEEVYVLEKFLEEWDWRPKEVKLFIFAMTASFSGGNDLADNFYYVRRERNKEAGKELTLQKATERKGWSTSAGLLEKVLGYRYTLLRHSNLLRLAKFYWGPLLRSTLISELDKGRLDEALRITGQQLNNLDQLSKKYGFEYSIYLLHPVQDIIRASHNETLMKLNSVSPVPMQGTGHLFQVNPTHFYYPYDGHLNKHGSKRVVELLKSQSKWVKKVKG